MSTILSRNDSRSDRPGSYERASDFLELALRPSEANDNPEARLAYARAQEELEQWFDSRQENPPSVAEGVERAQELADDFRLLSTENPLSLPFRSWMRGDGRTRGSLGMTDIEQLKQTIANDYRSGRIAEDEAASRAEDLEMWESYLNLRRGNTGARE